MALPFALPDNLEEAAMCGEHVDPKSIGNAFVRNLRRPMPLSEKLRLVLRNSAIKITRLQGCCGHPGEPGC